MKFTSASAVATLSALSGALAAPAPLQARVSFSAGAAYFMTNNPTGNAIVTATIDSDGTIALAQWYDMAGNGMRGASPFGGPDALFSQGAVRTHAGANLLAAVNPGSHSVSLFAINPDTPAELTALGAPVASGGQFPTSVAFNAAGTQLCALNAGEVNGVQCFAVDAATGLTTMANTARALGIAQTTPPAGPNNTASQLAFTADGSALVVAVKGGDAATTPGYLALWDVAPDGSLSSNFTRVEAPAGGAFPFSLTPVPGRNAFLSADYNVGADVFDLTGGAATATALPIAGQGATCWSAYSPATGSFYVSDTAMGQLVEIALADDLTPSIVATYPTPPTSGPIDLEVASLPDADYLYTLMPGTMSVGVMALNAAGRGQALQSMDLAGPAAANGLQMSPEYIAGMAVYVKTPPAAAAASA